MDLSIRSTGRRFGRTGWGLLALAIGWPGRVLAARRTMLQLAAFSDHELKDIGLVRQDLIDVSGLTLDQDPTLHLARRANERRRRR